MSTLAIEPTPTAAPAAKKKSILQYEITKKKVKPTELMHFSRQLGAFVKAGIPILDAIDMIAEEASSDVLKDALLNISTRIAGGSSFSGAAASHPEVFPNFYVRSLLAAELTGNLDTVLNQLSEYIERDEDAKRKIRAALVYPGIIFGMSIVTVVILMVFVLPKFESFFADFGADLPLATRILLGIGHGFNSYWFFIVGSIAAFVAIWFASMKTRNGRYFRDSLLLKLPVIGDVVRYAIIERFCRILASLMGAAVAIPEAMEVASGSTNNLVYEDALKKARASLMEGHGIAKPIAETKLFPPTVVQMVKVGENTGTLDTQLQTAAAYFDVELGYKIKKFTSLIEPVVIIVMGLVVGFVAIAMVSAMYGIYGQVGK